MHKKSQEKKIYRINARLIFLNVRIALKNLNAWCACAWKIGIYKKKRSFKLLEIWLKIRSAQACLLESFLLVFFGFVSRMPKKFEFAAAINTWQVRNKYINKFNFQKGAIKRAFSRLFCCKLGLTDVLVLIFNGCSWKKCWREDIRCWEFILAKKYVKYLTLFTFNLNRLTYSLTQPESCVEYF